MKKIILLGAAPIDGEMRFPSEGEIPLAPGIADELIKVGLAKDAGLGGLTVDELRTVAAVEGADIGPDAKKSDIVGAIKANRPSGD